MKEMPSHGASLRSSVHFEQTGLGGSPGSGKSLGDHAFEDAVVIDHQNQPTGLPFSIFCHKPAADGSARPARQTRRPTASPIATGSDRVEIWIVHFASSIT